MVKDYSIWKTLTRLSSLQSDFVFGQRKDQVGEDREVRGIFCGPFSERTVCISPPVTILHKIADSTQLFIQNLVMTSYSVCYNSLVARSSLVSLSSLLNQCSYFP